jgi:hypothetical protein
MRQPDRQATTICFDIDPEDYLRQLLDKPDRHASRPLSSAASKPFIEGRPDEKR